MLELPAARHRPHLYKPRQITCRCRRRTLRDAHIISRTESALKALYTLAKNSQHNFFLARIEQVAEAVEKLRLLNKELNTLETESLRLEHHRAKIFQPITNLVGTTGLLKRLVITLTPLLKNSRNRDQSRLTHSLRQRHFSNRSPNPTIAILEWMYRLEIKMRLARAGKVTLLPHLGSATAEGRMDMGEKVIVNIRAFMDGHSPPDRVLPSML